MDVGFELARFVHCRKLFRWGRDMVLSFLDSVTNERFDVTLILLGLINMNSGSEKHVQPTSVAVEKTELSALEETRSFLNNLPEIKKPEPKRSVIDDHLAFLNNLPKVNTQPKPVIEQVVEPDLLSGVVEATIEVDAGTESPNKRPQRRNMVSRMQERISQPQVIEEQNHPAQEVKAVAKA